MRNKRPGKAEDKPLSAEKDRSRPAPADPVPAAVQLGKYLVPAVLCVVAITQNIRAHTSGLTSWKGGGYGLFSTLDQLRFHRIYLAGRNWRQPLSGSEEFKLDLQRYVAWPSPDRGNKLAADIHNSPEVQELAGDDPDTWVTITVFDVDYDASSTLTCTPISVADSRKD